MKTQRDKSRSVHLFVLFLSLTVGLLFPTQSHAVSILTDIKIAPATLDVTKRETSRIAWQQALKGRVDVHICTLDGKIARTLLSQAEKEAGAQEIAWDGLDEFGTPCPIGAYIPIIRVKTQGRGYDVYNPTTGEWGRQITPEQVDYDTAKQKIFYHLTQSVICLMRMGEHDGGPAYKTSVFWEPKTSGDHEISWDGKDADGILPVLPKEKALIEFEAFTLPENAILLTHSETKPWTADRKYKTFPVHPPIGKDISRFALYFRSDLRDLKISVALAGADGKSKNPGLKGLQTLTLNILEEENLPELLRNGAEAYLFIDGKFLYELPLEKIPVDMKLDTGKIQNGEHLLVVNVKTRSNQMGIYSMRIKVKN
jgi:flagellar hook assembly protein FlgD